MTTLPTSISPQVEEALEDLAESLQVPEGRYEAAQRSFKSVGDWLHRPESTVRAANPQVYIQGSFRLGTVIRPISNAEDYDVDLVCELSLSKSKYTQHDLKTRLGYEITAYAKSHSLKDPTEGRRCWTLQYADSAQFHLDTLPAIPDGQTQRLLLEQHGLSAKWSSTAIAITDKDNANYRILSSNWPHSNPKGYSEWFLSRMAVVFGSRRMALAMEAKASVESIPEHRVRTPLQSAIQILKRHRDQMFDGHENKPISIILTTLAAHAYQQETKIGDALFGILRRMDQFIENRSGVSWVPNPTDEAENFADRWEGMPERKKAFYDWLEQAREDFARAAIKTNREAALSTLEPRFGKTLITEAKLRRTSPTTGQYLSSRIGAAVNLLNPAHRQPPPWHVSNQGKVWIEPAVYSRDGYRPTQFESDGSALPKHGALRFEADTNVPKPYKVYWQVVNTGREASDANSLRGGFDEGVVEQGKLTRKEDTLYRGRHSIECFIVKDGLAVRSGQFIVNIE
jgi:hypothetical protein